ncbi:DgyrCDS2212 [Dimorphilus gyrociliatus]|uniref:DgyrCDS2212 n=1 Tax=Dimorphilus gyrociliatus TaxID=2664684 RepID=A0A7I8V9K3_9ANNE|nr:DgyrCDS2212 [Dimorphilus gyrociliatus]
MDKDSIFIPGDIICPADNNYISGNGTVTRKNTIYASIAGKCNFQKIEDGKTVVEIRLKNSHNQNIVPTIDCLVAARITNVNPRFCKCAIISVDDVLLPESFRGLIRKEDARATEKDKVELYKSFRPGDIILARVLSLGDAQAYLLTTAENELGVVSATSESGETMIPISWCEMQCPKTLAKENRKVARVHKDYIINSLVTEAE